MSAAHVRTLSVGGPLLSLIRVMCMWEKLEFYCGLRVTPTIKLKILKYFACDKCLLKSFLNNKNNFFLLKMRSYLYREVKNYMYVDKGCNLNQYA